MNQFVFTSKQKTFLFGLMGLGVLSMLLCFFLEPSRYEGLGLHDKYLHTQFWTNLLHNAYFFTGIAFAALLFLVTHTLAYGGWQTAFKRVPEAMMMFMPVGVVFIAIVYVAGLMEWHGIYLWMEPGIAETDRLIAHKSSFVNKTTLGIALLIILGWYLFASRLRSLSIQEDNSNFGSANAAKKVWAAVFLPVAGFTSAFVIWQVVMSIDIHWYSTMFAWYSTASFFVSAVTLIILLLLWLKSLGYFPNVNKEHFHDLGKYAFGISVFWTYLWFSQFMLIWYANNGEETQYFDLRFQQFEPIFFMNIVLNFVLPFLILIRNTSKRILGTLGFACIVIFIGHWIDFFQQIKPGVWHNLEHSYHQLHEGHGDAHHEGHSELRLNDVHAGGQAMLMSHQTGDQHGGATHGEEHGVAPATAHDTTAHADHAAPAEGHAEGGSHEAHSNTHGGADQHGHGHEEAGLKSFYLGIHAPGLLEIGTFAGFLGLFLYVSLWYLSKAPLNPVNDAYYEESNHHQVM
jgi:hypothetical protein